MMIKVMMPFVSSGVGGATVSAAEMGRRLVHSGRASTLFMTPGAGAGTDLFEASGCEVLRYQPRGRTGRSLLPATSSFRQKLRALPNWLKLFADAQHALRLWEPDVIHLNEDRLVIPWAWAARTTRTPVVWHVRQERPNPQLDPIRLRLSDHLIFVADANRSRFPEGAKLPPYSLIYNVVNTEKFYPADCLRSAKEALGLDPHKLTVTFLGNLLERKRPDWALRAAAELQRHHQLQLLLVGSPLGGADYLDRLKELAAAAPRPDDIHFLSFRSDVPDLLRASDVVTLPSVPQGEAFPRAIIEAMMTGVPSVATRVAGVAEAIDHGATGLMVDPDSFEGYRAELNRILADDQLRRTLGTNARLRALERFSGADMAASLMEIYERLLSRR